MIERSSDHSDPQLALDSMLQAQSNFRNPTCPTSFPTELMHQRLPGDRKSSALATDTKRGGGQGPLLNLQQLFNGTTELTCLLPKSEAYL